MTHIRTRLMKAAKAGYSIDWIRPTAIAQACADQFGHEIKAVPQFVKA